MTPFSKLKTKAKDDPPMPTTEEQEAFYDAEIAPALAAIGKKCEDAGMSMVASVEWAPTEGGSTFVLAKGSSFAIRLVKLACEVRGNVDSMIIALRKYDPTGGGSVFLRVLNQKDI
jgi:hypothetical protein